MTALLPRQVRDLPGPPGLPVVGNLLQIRSDRLHVIAQEWSRVYGEFFRFRIGPREFMGVTNPEAIATILRDRPEGFQRSSRLNETAKEMGLEGLFSANGERWRRQRPMVMAALDPKHIKSYFPALVRVTERLARRWQRAAVAGMDSPLQADLMRYTVDVTAGLAFGEDINTLESDHEVIQTHLDKVLPAVFKRTLAPFPYWRYVKLPADRALDKHLAALHAAVDAFIRKARLRLDTDPSLRGHPTNLIEAMIAARDEAGSQLNDTDVAGNMLTMLLAGEDTTANTLAWMIYLLGRNPDAMQRARNEVRKALGTLPLPMQVEQASALNFVEACAHETMRLKPVAPIIPLEAARDCVVAGIHVPAGQMLMCFMRPGGMDPCQFPTPSSFDPARWLVASHAKAATSAKRAAMPFGAGPRLCPGRYLAMLEIKMVIGMLFGSFELERVSTPDGAEPREHLAFTMSPTELRIRLQPRSSFAS